MQSIRALIRFQGIRHTVFLVLALLFAGGLVGCGDPSPAVPAQTPSPAVAPEVVSIDSATDEIAMASGEEPVPALLPRLVDLGATKCIPCKKMAPILEDLKKDFQGKMEVEFIDVWENPDAGKAHAIKLIPTQIFFDAEGNELYRHQGFYSREDILGKWKELGVNLE